MTITKSRTDLGDPVVGDKITLSAEFETPGGTAHDPGTEVTCVVRAPDGTTTTYVYDSGNGDVAKDATGNYSVVHEIAEDGTHYGYWQGEGTDESDLQAFSFRATDPMP